MVHLDIGGVTIGGGSITDGGKAVEMCLANDIRAPEAIDKLRPVKGANGAVGPPPINPPTVRQISVPTTLSAGDFSALAGVTDERTKVKELLRHPRIMPSAVVLDPAITLNTPDWLWLSTGISAVDHCVEGVCSNEAHVFGDALALKGLALLANGLPRVKAQPKDLAARLDCQLGAWLSMGPLSSGVPMGASHGIGYVLGAEFGVPHGHTSCIMLPAVMRWNKPANRDRQALISAAMLQAGSDAGDVLDSLIRGLGMPRSLGAVKIGVITSNTSPSRPWLLLGCLATRGPSRDRIRCARYWSLPVRTRAGGRRSWHCKRPLHEYFGGYRGWILPPTPELDDLRRSNQCLSRNANDQRTSGYTRIRSAQCP